MPTVEKIEELKERMEMWKVGFDDACKYIPEDKRPHPPKILSEAWELLIQAQYELKRLHNEVKDKCRDG